MLVQELLEDMRGWYNDSMGKADPRAFDLPLAQTPVPILSILLLYILVVLHGPRMMEQQKPLNLRWLLVGYNFSMVALSFWIFVKTLQMAIRGRFSLVCQPIDYTDRPDAIEALYVGWLFFFSKIIELIDTVFFILRKKNSQITFLHVYHHTSIVVVTWSGMKWVSGGQSFLYPLLNSLVHVVMYLYYGLSAIGPCMQKYLWWKRYLTNVPADPVCAHACPRRRELFRGVRLSQVVRHAALHIRCLHHGAVPQLLLQGIYPGQATSPLRLQNKQKQITTISS